MSWFIGYTGKNNPILDNYISSIDFGEKNKINREDLNLFYGGKQENLTYIFNSDSTGCIICGIPIYPEEGEQKFTKQCNPDNWLNIDGINSKNINGHFAGIKWGRKLITFFNDQLGLRDIFFLKYDSNYLFSTRLDWTARFNRKNSVNIEEFSTSWILPHQISWGCPIKNIIRLGPGGIIKISSEKLEKNNFSWMPDFNISGSSSEFIDALNNFLNMFPRESIKINLGLSGGIDSRVLLQLIYNNHITNFGTHTFGGRFTADGEIAQRIIDDYKIEHHYFTVLFPETDLLLNNLYKNVSQLGLSSSIFETLNYRFYKELDELKFSIIDGAYGEIFRRAYLNKFLILGKDALLSKDVKTIFKLLRREKSDIFNDELAVQMENYAMEHILKLLESLPDPKLIGIENWLDTFFIKTKVANISGPSQTLLDNICHAFMPFIQVSVLNRGLSLDITEKKNGKLFWQIIIDGEKFNKYPLVKDQIIYPFNKNLLFTRIYQKIKRKAGLIKSDNVKLDLLLKLKNFVMDKIESQEVKNFDLYNYDKVSNQVWNFYNGNKSLADNLIWWITFEIWRESYNIR